MFKRIDLTAKPAPGKGPVARVAPACANTASCAGACGLARWCESQGMSPAVAAAFASGWTVNRYSRGNILFYQANEPFGLFFLSEGHVKLIRAERDGRRQIVRIVHGPDFVGERALIAGQPYAATAEVMGEARICVIDAARFWKAWGERPELPRALARHLAAKLGAADESTASLAMHTIRERLAKLIALYAETAPNPAAPILLNESRTELAELLGTSPEVVSRTLKELTQRKMIAPKGQTVRVLDAARLRAAARLPALPSRPGLARVLPR